MMPDQQTTTPRNTIAPHVAYSALDAAGIAVLITGAQTDLPGPIIRYANPAMEALTGFTIKEMIGATPRIFQGPQTDRDTLDDLRASLRGGVSFTGEAINHRKDGTPYNVAWVIDPVLDDRGAITAWMAVQQDVTELRRKDVALQDADRRLRILVGELQHRTRNLMGIIRSMTQRIIETSENLPDFTHRFTTRLDALARVQSLLSRLDQDERVTFDVLIHNEMLALDGPADRTTLSGPIGIRLRSSTVQLLSLVLHELATNALKYGALGQEDARLSITWSFEPEGPDGRPWLHIEWTESSVRMPSDAAMAVVGQGRELIEESLPHQFGAHVTYALNEGGLHCSIALPVSSSNVVDTRA